MSLQREIEQVKRNEIIADFMQIEKVEYKSALVIQSTGESARFDYAYNHPKGHIPTPATSMKYNVSWDWLMPVIEKCYNLEISEVTTEIETLTGDITHALVDCDIKETFNAVVKFITAINK